MFEGPKAARSFVLWRRLGNTGVSGAFYKMAKCDNG